MYNVMILEMQIDLNFSHATEVGKNRFFQIFLLGTPGGGAGRGKKE